MATSTSSKKVTVAGVSTAALDSGTYTSYTWVESGTGTKAGANTFNVSSATTTAVLTLTGTSGDVVKVNGYSGDYSASLSKSTLTLQSDTQTIKIALAKSSTVTLNFVDGKKVVDFTVATKPKLDSVALTSKVSHINGQTAHEAAALALAAADKATALATAATDKATALAAAATDKTTALANAATDKANAVTAALTDSSGTHYANVNAAIVANDTAVTTAAISSALSGTAFTSIADLLTAYKAFAPSFSVTTNPSAIEGSDATFTISLSAAQTTPTTVNIALAGTGGAVAGTDFGTATGATLSGNVLTFASGQTTATVKVPVTADGIAETGEGLKLTLTGTTGSTIGVNAAAGSASVALVDASNSVNLSATLTSAVATAGLDTFNVASGTYAALISGFAAGDKLHFFPGASVTVLPDTNQTDGIQQLTASDPTTGATATITLSNLTSTQDATLFNVASFDTLFGTNTVIVDAAIVAPVLPTTVNLSATTLSGTGTTAVDTFNVASGTYNATINSFGNGDKLNFFTGASITVLPDTNQTDGIQQVSAADSTTGSTTTLTFTGLTAAQDAALFNLASFNSTFGTGTVLIASTPAVTPLTANLAAGNTTATGTTAADTFNFASGTYTATITINNFASGDNLRFFAGASLTVLPDTDQTDGIQQISAADTATGATTTVILTGLTSAQDGGVFNVTSFNTVFGAGSIA